MSRQRQKLSVFFVLVVVLGLTLVLGYRMNRPASTAAVQSAEKAPGAKPPVASDARIRLDIVDNPGTNAEIGQKNLFQYGRLPEVPQEVSPRDPEESAPPPVTTPPVPAVPAGPPPPPPVPLKFTGFAIVNSSLTAFLSDSSGNFIVTAGEVLMGRYRITQITNSTVEVEDLEYNRRQMLALQK